MISLGVAVPHEKTSAPSSPTIETRPRRQTDQDATEASICGQKEKRTAGSSSLAQPKLSKSRPKEEMDDASACRSRRRKRPTRIISTPRSPHSLILLDSRIDGRWSAERSQGVACCSLIPAGGLKMLFCPSSACTSTANLPLPCSRRQGLLPTGSIFISPGGSFLSFVKIEAPGALPASCPAAQSCLGCTGRTGNPA